MHKITRPVNIFLNLQPQLSAVSWILHELMKFWTLSSICGDFQLRFHCACSEVSTGIYELSRKILTSTFDGVISQPDFVIDGEILAI